MLLENTSKNREMWCKEFSVLCGLKVKPLSSSLLLIFSSDLCIHPLDSFPSPPTSFFSFRTLPPFKLWMIGCSFLAPVPTFSAVFRTLPGQESEVHLLLGLRWRNIWVWVKGMKRGRREQRMGKKVKIKLLYVQGILGPHKEPLMSYFQPLPLCLSFAFSCSPSPFHSRRGGLHPRPEVALK